MNPKEEFEKLVSEIRYDYEVYTLNLPYNFEKIVRLIEQANYLGYQEAKQECDDWIERHERT